MLFGTKQNELEYQPWYRDDITLAFIDFILLFKKKIPLKHHK